ncbi:MAG: hypothetical protein AB7F89_26755 [Pirellulaceae bacterium]
MSPQTRMKPGHVTGQVVAAPGPEPWRVGLRVLASVVLMIHVLAVFMGPFTFATSSGPGMASPFAEPIRGILRPYLDLAFLDHGYFFFAPNPGPSHLLRVQLDYADGRPMETFTLPDRARQWSRLLYHRQFMLAEQFHADYVPAQPPPEAATDPVQLENWRQARRMFELKESSFLQHLRQTYGAEKVTLTRVEHGLLPPAEFAATRRPIRDAATYVDLTDPPNSPLPVPGPRP